MKKIIMLCEKRELGSISSGDAYEITLFSSVYIHSLLQVEVSFLEGMTHTHTQTTPTLVAAGC